MQRLAGLNSIIVFLIITIGLTFFFNQLSADTYKQTCIGNTFVLTNITPTIQTIAKLSRKEDGGKVSLIRGRIEFMAVTNKAIIGYLSTRFFKEDDLIGLEGDNDKEGFFIIRKKDSSVELGLDGKTFFNKMEDQYHQKNIEFLKPEQIPEFGECK